MRVANSGRSADITRSLGLSAWTSTRTCSRTRTSGSGSRQLLRTAPAQRRRERRAGRALPAGRHPPVRGPHVRTRRRRWSPTCPRCSPRPATAPSAPGSARWRGFARFFTERFPAALYRLRWWWLGCLAANVVVTAVMMLWLLDHPNVEQSLLSPDEVDQLVNNDFENYYSEYAASHFAAQVWINNAWVSALCIALRDPRLPGDLPAVQQHREPRDHRLDHAPRTTTASYFWGLILPHGLLELTAVFVAGGVGLRLFWSWIEPGRADPRPVDRPRGPHRRHGRARAGRRAVRQRRHRGVRDPRPGCPPGPGSASASPPSSAFFAYVFVLGRQAYHRGATGDIDAATSRTGSPPRPDPPPQAPQTSAKPATGWRQ